MGVLVALYAFVMGRPPRQRPAVLTFITKMNARLRPVASVELLGHDGALVWDAHPDGLQVTFPKELPTEFAHGLRIRFDDVAERSAP